ncbi:hypothetical protein FSW04_13045 [Baekduia soli]|uniref:Uncharacterized protein n=1 Tax=Baekduia soli TaxID=496014 RepID=A0A5B8U5P2_9ACTN|nr:hypothetical protein [Baekduia soli]QEC48403.1 hypothetical protein FSW04_13045 [Baekduia soli]
MGAGAGVLRGPGEVAEDEASGEAARAYARLRDALGAAFVPTVFRMLGRHGPYLAAGVDAVLEHADASALEQLAADGRAVGAAAAAGLPGPALDAGREAPAVAALLERYNTVNPRGIAFVLALRGDTARPPAPVLRAPLPPPVPGLLDDVRACHAGLTVPGLWRELAAGHPAVAGQAWALVRPLAGDPALEAARDAVTDGARRLVAGVAAPDPAALGCDEDARREIAAILDWFVVAIPTMVVVIEILRARLAGGGVPS